MNETITVGEGSTAFFEVDLKDATGTAAAPLQAFLTVYDLKTRAVVLAEMELTAGAVLAIKIPGASNAIINRSNASETKRAYVRCVYGVGDPFTTSRDYVVRRLIP